MQPRRPPHLLLEHCAVHVSRLARAVGCLEHTRQLHVRLRRWRGRCTRRAQQCMCRAAAAWQCRRRSGAEGNRSYCSCVSLLSHLQVARLLLYRSLKRVSCRQPLLRRGVDGAKAAPEARVARRQLHRRLDQPQRLLVLQAKGATGL